MISCKIASTCNVAWLHFDWQKWHLNENFWKYEKCITCGLHHSFFCIWQYIAWNFRNMQVSHLHDLFEKAWKIQEVSKIRPSVMMHKFHKSSLVTRNNSYKSFESVRHFSSIPYIHNLNRCLAKTHEILMWMNMKRILFTTSG